MPETIIYQKVCLRDLRKIRIHSDKIYTSILKSSQDSINAKSFTMVGFPLTVVKIFADFSVNSQPIFMKFYTHYFPFMSWIP